MKPNRFAIVDTKHFAMLRRYKWRMTGLGYAGTHEPGTDSTIYMHNLVAGRKGIDHRDGKKLNNRRRNLRPATTTENNRNSKRFKTNRCGFKGVTRAGKRWRARISINSKYTHIGTFDTPRRAHRAYVAAARKHFGAFARAG